MKLSKFTMPEWVMRHNINCDNIDLVPDEVFDRVRNNLEKLKSEDPEVSIVIPAYNEEKDILKTLSSLSELKTNYRTEIIVANNNSTDRTQEILDRCGVNSVFVTDQGITYARQAGLEMARGKYILNADSDSIYPATWADPMVEALENQDISCAYGTYSFIPCNNNSRFALGFYEMTAETFFKIKKKNRECVNVMGYNFAFRKEDALAVGGFCHTLERHITGRSDDGWMAYCLQTRGRIQQVVSQKCRVWTSDRRLMMDGSLSKAFTKRAKKELSRLAIYFQPTPIIHN